MSKEQLNEQLPNLTIEQGINPKNGMSCLILNLDGIENGEYLTSMGVVRISRRNEGQEVVIAENNITRVIQIGADGRGSQQISRDLDLLVDLGRRLRPMYRMIRREIDIPGFMARSRPTIKVVWEHGREIWTR